MRRSSTFWESHRGQVGGSHACRDIDIVEQNKANIINYKISTWYLGKWLDNHSVKLQSNDLRTHPV